MLAGVLILAFWAYLIWIWNVLQAPVDRTERKTIRTPNRWN